MAQHGARAFRTIWAPSNPWELNSDRLWQNAPAQGQPFNTMRSSLLQHSAAAAAAKPAPLVVGSRLQHVGMAWTPSQPLRQRRSCSSGGGHQRWRRPAGFRSNQDGEGIDIDALAKRLSQEAERLRQMGASLSSEEEDGDEAAYEAQPDAGRQETARRAAGQQPDLLRPFGYEVGGWPGRVVGRAWSLGSISGKGKAAGMRRYNAHSSCLAVSTPSSRTSCPPASHNSQINSAEADVLSAVGEGGFVAEEFELQQELGTVSIQQVR